MFDVNSFVTPAYVNEGLLTELIDELRDFGIEGALFSPLNPEDYSNSWLLNRALLRAVGRVRGGYAAPVFEEGVWEIASSSGVKALRLYPPTGERRLEAAAELCERLCLPLIVSLRVAWSGPSIDFRALEPILKEYRGLKIILSGVNYTETKWLVSEVSSLSHVYVEISMFQQMEGIRLLIRRLGADRVLLGTAYPLQSPYVSILKLLFSGLRDEEIEKVTQKNAAKLLNIE